jgi:hypothetical protein
MLETWVRKSLYLGIATYRNKPSLNYCPYTLSIGLKHAMAMFMSRNFIGVMFVVKIYFLFLLGTTSFHCGIQFISCGLPLFVIINHLIPYRISSKLGSTLNLIHCFNPLRSWHPYSGWWMNSKISDG